jgi:polysaccharide export outer membrane protein
MKRDSEAGRAWLGSKYELFGWKSTVSKSSLVSRAIALLVVATLAACDLPRSGPSAAEVAKAAASTTDVGAHFALVDLNASIVGRMENWATASLQGTFGRQGKFATEAIGVGDSIQVVIWEAAAGGLFSAPANDRLGPGTRSAVIPEQVVGGSDGAITVPYAGRVRVVGKAPRQVEQEIVQALTGKAIEPQALVTVTKNVANTVTLIGEVTDGARVPLTTRGDRILDVIASAGGIKVAAHETFITLVREGKSVRIPMQAILSNPAENIYLRPGDVISVARDPQTFTAAGATGANSVIPFDAIGITLDQAIAKAGGLNDYRADPTGVFVVRYEPAAAYDQLGLIRPTLTAMSQIPVIYRINMRDPSSFFVAHRFPIRNKDIVYVSNASATDLQKTMNILLPFIGAGATAAAVTAATR